VVLVRRYARRGSCLHPVLIGRDWKWASVRPAMRGSGSRRGPAWFRYAWRFRHAAVPKCDCHRIPTVPYALWRDARRRHDWHCVGAPPYSAGAGTPPRDAPDERFPAGGNYVRYRRATSAPSIAQDPLRTVARRWWDIGSAPDPGELLLASGAQVIGSSERRPCAPLPRHFARQARFRSVNGTAECTTLAPASIDLLVAARHFTGSRSRNSREALACQERCFGAVVE